MQNSVINRSISNKRITIRQIIKAVINRREKSKIRWQWYAKIENAYGPHVKFFCKVLSEITMESIIHDKIY